MSGPVIVAGVRRLPESQSERLAMLERQVADLRAERHRNHLTMAGALGSMRARAKFEEGFGLTEAERQTMQELADALGVQP